MGILAVMTFGLLTAFSCNEKSPQQSTTSAVDTTVKTIAFVNGISAQNKGTHTGQSVLKGKVTAPLTGKIYLWETSGKNVFKTDSTKIENGLFVFSKKDREEGIYMIGLNDNNMSPVIIQPNEQVCEIGFSNARLEGSLYATASKENECLAKYLPQETALLKAIKDAKVAGAKSASMKVQFDQQASQKEAELLKLQSDLIAQYPGTFAAKLLTWKQEPWKTDIKKYWDNIEFTDESVIRTKVLSDRIESFMRSFSKGEESGFINCVAQVVEKAKVNDRVLEFSLNQMLVGFYESGLENICSFIIDNYINGDACGDADLSNVIKNTAESIQNLSVGKTPPNIKLTGLDGSAIDLFKMAAVKKYTLVMFWSSWCEHCKGEAPEVKACYDSWKSKGFEILGVSIDNNKQAWQKAVTERGFTFPQVCGMNSYQSPVAKDYRITKTPAFYLLDNTGKIVLKPKGIREVQQYLATNLK